MRLQIIFRGLCAFVPNEASGTSANTAIQGLLIEGRTPTKQTTSSSVYHVAHIPALRFNLADLDPDPDDSLPNYYVDSKKSEGIWILDRDDLKIMVYSQEHTGQLIYSSDQMFEMNRIYDQGLRVRANCLSAATIGDEANHLSNANLVGRIKLVGGKFEAFRGTNGTGLSRNLRFVRHDGTIPTDNTWGERPVASATLYESSILTSDKIGIFSKTIKKGLTFSPSNGRTNVRLIIENVPSSDRVGHVDNVSGDQDFRLVYKIAQKLTGANRDLLETEHRLPKEVQNESIPPPIFCGSAMFNTQS